MESDKRKITLDNDTVASHPGRLRVSPLRWLQFRPLWPLIWTAILLGAIYSALAVHWGFWAAALFMLIWNWLYWKRLQEHFYNGCANPAEVVSTEPFLVAAHTDLRCGFDAPHCHSIKIFKTRLPKNGDAKYAVGDKLPTVSLYYGAMDKMRWMGFDPIPACLVSDEKDSVSGISAGLAEEWGSLETWLEKVPRPLTAGLYAFDQGNDVPRGETQDPVPLRERPWRDM